MYKIDLDLFRNVSKNMYLFLILSLFGILVVALGVKDDPAALASFAPLAILTAVLIGVTFNQTYILFYSHKESVQVSYKEKQLQYLYLPLYFGLKNPQSLEMMKIKKYSYLAAGQLQSYMKKLLEIDDMSIAMKDSKNVYLLDEIKTAVDNDIEKINDELRPFLKIDY